MRGPIAGIVNGLCFTMICGLPLLILWLGLNK